MRATTILILAMLLASGAHAETFRCTLQHIVRTSDYKGLVEDNREANKDTEFFVAIAENGQGTQNVCTKTGCTAQTIVQVLERDGNEQAFKQELRFLVNRYELWHLEKYRNSIDWDATAVSGFGLTSMTRYGKCRIIIPR